MTQTQNDKVAALLALVERDDKGFAVGNSRPGGDYWNGLVEQIMNLCDGICACCGKRKATEVGHIIPAGRNREGYYNGNLVGMCRACNKTVKARVPNWRNFANVDAIMTDYVPVKVHVDRDDEEDVTDELTAMGIL